MLQTSLELSKASCQSVIVKYERLSQVQPNLNSDSGLENEIKSCPWPPFRESGTVDIGLLIGMVSAASSRGVNVHEDL